MSSGHDGRQFAGFQQHMFRCTTNKNHLRRRYRSAIRKQRRQFINSNQQQQQNWRHIIASSYDERYPHPHPVELRDLHRRPMSNGTIHRWSRSRHPITRFEEGSDLLYATQYGQQREGCGQRDDSQAHRETRKEEKMQKGKHSCPGSTSTSTNNGGDILRKRGKKSFDKDQEIQDSKERINKIQLRIKKIEQQITERQSEIERYEEQTQAVLELIRRERPGATEAEETEEGEITDCETYPTSVARGPEDRFDEFGGSE